MGVFIQNIRRVVLPGVLAVGFLSCGSPPPPAPPPIVEAEVSEAVSVAEAGAADDAASLPAAVQSPEPSAPGSAPSSGSSTLVRLNESVVDDMEMTAGWRLYKDQTSMIRVAAVPGYRGNAVRLEYDFAQGKWLGIWKFIGDVSKARGIRFTYRCEGARNTIEYKIEDTKNTCYGRALSTEVRGWTTIEIPFTLMSYWWGDDPKLDLTRAKVHFAVAVRAGDEGGKGTIFIDQVELLR